MTGFSSLARWQRNFATFNWTTWFSEFNMLLFNLVSYRMKLYFLQYAALLVGISDSHQSSSYSAAPCMTESVWNIVCTNSLRSRPSCRYAGYINGGSNIQNHGHTKSAKTGTKILLSKFFAESSVYPVFHCTSILPTSLFDFISTALAACNGRENVVVGVC